MPHTAHRFGVGARSDSTALLAKSIISGATIGSAVDFFFMVDFTIVQKYWGFRRDHRKSRWSKRLPEYSSYSCDAAATLVASE